MRCRLTCRCRDFLLRNRQAYLCCALVVLNILILLLIWPILKPNKPSVYAIVDLGGSTEGDESLAQFERRKNVLFSPTVLRGALDDLSTTGFWPRWWDEQMWLRQVMWVEPLDNSSLVRVGVAEGTPAEQAAIVNAILRAYIRYFEAEEKKVLNDWQMELESGCKSAAKTMEGFQAELSHLKDRRENNDSPNLEWREKQLEEKISNIKQMIQQAAAKMERIRAAAGNLPTVIEWAQAP